MTNTFIYRSYKYPILFLLIATFFTAYLSLSKNINLKNNNQKPTDQLVFNLLPSSVCLTEVDYNLNLNNPSHLSIQLRFCPNQTNTIALTLPKNFILENIYWNNAPVMADQFVIKDHQLFFNLKSTDESENLLSLQLNRQSLPNNFNLFAISSISQAT